MPSPFPGMNPYLEQESVWHGFHIRFIARAAEALVPQVRPQYIVGLDEHAYIHELPADDRRLMGRPDVAIFDRGRGVAGSAAAIAAAAAAPTYVELTTTVDIERISYIAIRDRETRSLVTAIELLSPTNKKMGPDREQYLQKRLKLLASDAHLVEIDLLRGGPRMPPDDLPGCDYYGLVSRVDERPRAGIWPLRLREPLPAIPIPLRPPHADAKLDLKGILDHVYDAAGYEDYIYQGLPRPRLHPDDAAWARAILGK